MPAKEWIVDKHIITLGDKCNYIQSIKDLRAATGIGLKEAKDIIDLLKYSNENENVRLFLTDEQADILINKGFTVNENKPSIDYSTQKYKIFKPNCEEFIQSIKDFRIAIGCGLKEAKEAVEIMRNGDYITMGLTQENVYILIDYGFIVTPLFQITIDDDIF